MYLSRLESAGSLENLSPVATALKTHYSALNFARCFLCCDLVCCGMAAEVVELASNAALSRFHFFCTLQAWHHRRWCSIPLRRTSSSSAFWRALDSCSARFKCGSCGTLTALGDSYNRCCYSLQFLSLSALWNLPIHCLTNDRTEFLWWFSSSATLPPRLRCTVWHSSLCAS